MKGNKVEKKFGALRTVARIQKIIAYLTGVFAAFAFAFGVIDGDPIGALGAIFGGAILFITQFALAELIDLFLQMEENTREAAAMQKRSAMMLQRMLRER